MSIINVDGIDIEIAGKEINKEEFNFIIEILFRSTID